MDRNLKILITGGNGFIARNIYEAFCSKYNVTSVNKEELNLLDSEEVKQYLNKNLFDVIIHTATYDAAPKFSLKNPAKVLENNLKMFFNLTRCKDFFGKMVYYGSGAEFDKKHWIPNMSENYFDSYVPSDQYGYSKYLMAKYTHEVDYIYNLRLFGVFGKYDDWRYRFIPNICANAAMNNDIIIKNNAIFDHVYIKDIVKITDWFIKNQPNEKVFNICSGKTYDRISLAKKLISLVDNKIDYSVINKKINIEYSGKNSLLLKTLNGYKFYDIDSAINELYQYYRCNLDSINKSELSKHI